MTRTRVLICDDNRFFCRMLRALLQTDLHIEIIGEASGGGEAIRLAEMLRPDIVLMDLKMADMDGAKATRVIKEAYPNIKVLILTFLNDTEKVANCVQAGASGYVVKGLQAPELIRAIQTVSKGEHYFSPQISKHVERMSRRSPVKARRRRGGTTAL